MKLADKEPSPRKPMLKAEARERLTPREAEVTQWLGEGKKLREIGKLLDRSPRTMGKHRDSSYFKLGVNSRVDLLLKWFIAWVLGVLPGDALPVLAEWLVVA